MRYRTPALKLEMAPVKKDLKEMGIEQIETRPGVSLIKTNLPPSTLVFLLNY